MNAAVTALKYEYELLNVTRAEPSGYLCLSVSMPIWEIMIYVLMSFEIMLKIIITGIDNTFKKFVHNFGQTFGRQLTVQCTDKNRFTWIQFL